VRHEKRSKKSADLAVARVNNRVRQGGHNVPEPIVIAQEEGGKLLAHNGQFLQHIKQKAEMSNHE